MRMTPLSPLPSHSLPIGEGYRVSYAEGWAPHTFCGAHPPSGLQNLRIQLPTQVKEAILGRRADNWHSVFSTHPSPSYAKLPFFLSLFLNYLCFLIKIRFAIMLVPCFFLISFYLVNFCYFSRKSSFLIFLFFNLFDYFYINKIKIT